MTLTATPSASGLEFHLRLDRDDVLAAEATDGDPKQASTSGLIAGARVGITVAERLRALWQIAERVERAQKGRVTR